MGQLFIACLSIYIMSQQFSLEVNNVPFLRQPRVKRRVYFDINSRISADLFISISIFVESSSTSLFSLLSACRRLTSVKRRERQKLHARKRKHYRRLHSILTRSLHRGDS